MYLTSPRAARDSLFFLRSQNANQSCGVSYHGYSQASANKISPNTLSSVKESNDDEDIRLTNSPSSFRRNQHSKKPLSVHVSEEKENLRGLDRQGSLMSNDTLSSPVSATASTPSSARSSSSLVDWTDMKKDVIETETGMLSSPLSTLCYQDMLDLIELMKKGGTHQNLVIGKAQPLQMRPRKVTESSPKSSASFPPFVKGWITSSSPSSQNLQFIFYGTDLVDWLLNHVKKTWGLRTRLQACKLAQVLCDYAHICCRDDTSSTPILKIDEPFCDDTTNYMFSTPQRLVLNSPELLYTNIDSLSISTVTPAQTQSSPVSPSLFLGQPSPNTSPSATPSPVQSELALQKFKAQEPQVTNQRGISRSSSSPAMAAANQRSIFTASQLSSDFDPHRDQFPAELQQMKTSERALFIVSQALKKVTDISKLAGDYKGVEIFKRFPQETSDFMNYIVLLPFLNLSSLTPTQHICFWLNTHNLLYLHGMLYHPLFATASVQPLFPGSHHLRFLHSCHYLISGYFFSLLDIHHAILRSSLPHTLTPPPSSYPAAVPFPPSFSTLDPRRIHNRRHSVELASLITFSLIHCYADSPQLMIMSDEFLSSQLLYMTQLYLKNHMSVTVVTNSSNTFSSSSPSPHTQRNTIISSPTTFLQVELPNLFSLYSPDFGASLTSLMTWVSAHHWDYVERSRFADFAAARKVVMKIKIGVRILANTLPQLQEMTSLLDDDDEYGCGDQYAVY
jgi:hypothetical protein